MDQRSSRIGARIREIRTARGVTLDELAQAMGVTRQQVGRLEAGKRTLRPDTLEQIAAALGVPLTQLEGEDDLAAWVADMLRLLGYAAEVRQSVRDEYGISFSADVVATLSTGPIEVRVVLACRQAVTVEDVQALQVFVEHSDYHLGVVVTVIPPGPNVLDYAARHGTLMVRRDDLLARLVDLGAYARSLDERWRAREVRFVEPRVERAAGGQVQTLQELVDSWLAEPGITHLVLLGEPGSGKTTACQHLAALLARRHLQAPLSNPAPLLVPLWEFSYVHDLEKLVFKDLLFRWGAGIAGTAALERMLAEGRFVVLLDGLDEMSVRQDPYTLRSNLRAISGLLGSGSRVLLTARTRTFRDALEPLEVLGCPGRWTLPGEGGRAAGVEVARLMLFDEQQIEAYLRSHSRRGWPGTLARIEQHGLGELARLPLALHLLGQALPEPSVRQGGVAALSTVLNQAVEAWAQPEALRLCIPRTELLHLLEELAFQIWVRNQPRVGPRELPAGLAALLDAEAGGGWRGDDGARHGLGNSLFLRRDPEGGFCFTHHLLQDFLAVRHVFRGVRAGRPQDLARFWFEPATARLAVGMLGEPGVAERLLGWLEGHADPNLRAIIAYLLGLPAGIEADEALWRAFRQDPELEVRHAAAFSLARRGSVELVRLLGAEAARSEPGRERTWARISLALLAAEHWGDAEPPPDALDAIRAERARWSDATLCADLRPLLADATQPESARSAAARAAGVVGDAMLQATLEDLLSQPQPRLRAAAQEALSVLEGRFARRTEAGEADQRL
ncbi:MAG: helix-turn-helix domain-containing protein [Pseudomonadota bacterium]